jgi:hypothetical protein
MIVKHIAIRNLNKSSFSGLVNYITNPQQKNERVGSIRITNCQSELPAWAAVEAEAIQLQNKRSLVDKTYHMLVSFREGENPSPEVLRDIEDRLCAALGYQDHQRVSAIHHDTDHLHIHIAINKVHPVKLTTRQPYNDYKIFAALCTKLEKEHRLDIDNHIPRMTQGEARAQDMERSAGVESLIGWIKRGCLPELLVGESWQELHKVLAKNGLTLSERGNGLVIKDGNDVAVKASSLNRNLSKNALEKRFGTFQPCVSHEVQIDRKYEIKPVASKVDTKKLWDLYQYERMQHKQRHVVLKDRAKQRKERRVDTAKKMTTVKRTVIKLTKGRLAKNILHSSVSDSFLKEMQTIRNDYRDDSRKVYEKGKHVVWYDWLKAKAWEGNGEALEVLRHRYEREIPIKANSIAGHEIIDRVNYRAGAKIEAVTKRGTIHYQVAQTVLRDDGKVFRLAEHVSRDVVEAALRMSIQRFGTQLAISGTDGFRRQVVEVAAGAKLNLVFTEPEMEVQRKALIAANNNTGINPSIPDVAALYIAERTDTRNKGIDILPHRQYDEADAGKHSYAGIRQVEGKTLMLLQTPSEMLVLPIDANTAQHIQRLKIGSMIDVTAQGIVRTHTRKM